MPPEESTLPSEESKKIAYFAFACFKYTSETLHEKLGDEYTPYEEIFAFAACLTDVAFRAGMPLDLLQVNIEAMYKTKCEHEHGAENDTTH